MFVREKSRKNKHNTFDMKYEKVNTYTPKLMGVSNIEFTLSLYYVVR